MKTVKLPAGLDSDLANELRNVFSYFKNQHKIDLIWNNLLSGDERSRLAGNRSPLKMIECWAESRGHSFERAFLDMALEALVIDAGRHRRWRRQIGQPVERGDDPARPVWDRGRGELRFRGQVVRKVFIRGKNMRSILDAFEEQGWPARIDNPLPGGANSCRLRETLRSLNQNLMAVRFYADGTATGIIWQRVDARAHPRIGV